jgi:hypothetical protein
MSNRSQLFEYVAGLSEDQAGAALAALNATPAAVSVSDTPDGNGCVGLPNVKNRGFATVRFPVKKIADALPPGSLARATAEIALGEAQGSYNIFRAVRSYPVYECEQYVDDTTGMPGFRLKTVGPNNDPVAIPGAAVFPPVVVHGFDLGTAQGLSDYLDWVAPSSFNLNPAIGPR